MAHAHDPEQDDDDALLVVRVGEGDPAAYRELVRRHAAPLHQYALRLTRHPTDAEDVVQETFLRLWLHATDYTPSARVTTWLHRIAHNLSVDRLRARKPWEELDEASDAMPSSESQPQLLDAKRSAEALHQALDTLPKRQALAIMLVHLHGLSGEEASSVLGVGEAALESLLSRARRALKARLGDAPAADFGGSP